MRRPRLGDATDATDDLGVALAVLQRDVEGLLGGRILDLVASDVALLTKVTRATSTRTLVEGMETSGLVGRVRVANARQHVRNGIGNLRDPSPSLMMNLR